MKYSFIHTEKRKTFRFRDWGLTSYSHNLYIIFHIKPDLLWLERERNDNLTQKGHSSKGKKKRQHNLLGKMPSDPQKPAELTHWHSDGTKKCSYLIKHLFTRY